jgi:hypothetical protein
MIIPLEITSAHRDRSIYKNPFFFKITFNNTGLNLSGIDATDPITLQLPIAIGNYENISPNTSIIQWEGLIINVTGIITSISDNDIQINFTSAFNQTPNYYRGLTMIFVSNTWSYINSYTYLGSNIGLFSLNNIPTTIPTVGSAISIFSNPTQPGITNLSVLFVPSTIHNMELVDKFCYNETLDESRRILRYNEHNSQILVSEPAIAGWSNIHTYSIRQEIPLVSTVVSSTPNSITVSASLEGFNVGDFIKNTNTQQIVIIVNINYVTQTLTFAPSSPIVWIIGTVVEICKFNSDNANFITYSGIQRESLTTEYEIELISLYIPKCILKNNLPSSRLSHVYVELSDTSNPNINNIMSNNPGNRKALFKATLSSQLSEYNSKKPFLKFGGDGSKKNIKFRLSAASFIFAIRDSSGQVLSNVILDTLSPNPPNPLLQCQALFNIKH